MEDRKLAELLVIFETDFEDLTRGQLQFLRIRYREETGIKDTLTKEQLFEAYLNLKGSILMITKCYCFVLAPAWWITGRWWV